MANVPLHRFEEFGVMTSSERSAVLHLADAPITVRKAHIIRREAVEVKGFYLLVDGWASAACGLTDGRRQIMKIHLPGDALGTPSMAMLRTTEELCAITDATVAHVPLVRFGQLFTDHPRMVAKFMLSIQLERIALMDRLASIGKMSAKARLAAFLLDFSDRLLPLGLSDGSTFQMLLSQEHIGDVIGVTNVHVNRVLAELTKDNLIERFDKRMRLIDIKGLARLAARPERTLNADQPWMPPGRC